MLALQPLITISSGDTVDRLTSEQARARAIELSRRVAVAKGMLTRERVALGWFLLQVKGAMRHGEFTRWLDGGAVHLKTARRCMRLAAAVGDEAGGVDRRRLFALLHAASPDLFPSLESFEADRVSMARVDAALDVRDGIRAGVAGCVASTPCVGEKGQGVSVLTGSGGVEQEPLTGALELPRARVRDVAGQGVLGAMFAPLVQRLERVADAFERMDQTRRDRARDIIARCERELGGLLA